MASSSSHRAEPRVKAPPPGPLPLPTAPRRTFIIKNAMTGVLLGSVEPQEDDQASTIAKGWKKGCAGDFDLVLVTPAGSVAHDELLKDIATLGEDGQRFLHAIKTKVPLQDS